MNLLTLWPIHTQHTYMSTYVFMINFIHKDMYMPESTDKNSQITDAVLGEGLQVNFLESFRAWWLEKRLRGEERVLLLLL